MASVGVKDTGSGFFTGSSSREGSVPAPLDASKEVFDPLDQYPWIMQRLRLRRLLSFLASTRFYDAYVAMQSDASLVLDLKYLQRYLVHCQWVDARNYIMGILPYHLMGEDGRTLMDFLTYLMFMHNIATGHQNAPLLIDRFERSLRDPAVLRDANRYRIMRAILAMRFQKARTSIDWNEVGKKAAEIVRDFINQAPEFSDYLRLPRRCSDVHNVVNVLPRGFRPRRTRIVKKAGRVPASVIAKYFLPKGRLQPGTQRMGCSGLVTDPSAWLRSAIYEALKTGYPYNEGMDRKRSWSIVSQGLDAGSYPQRPRKDKVRVNPIMDTGREYHLGIGFHSSVRE